MAENGRHNRDDDLVLALARGLSIRSAAEEEGPRSVPQRKTRSAKCQVERNRDVRQIAETADHTGS